jgi:hypothetical protein
MMEIGADRGNRRRDPKSERLSLARPTVRGLRDSTRANLTHVQSQRMSGDQPGPRESERERERERGKTGRGNGVRRQPAPD